MEAFEKIKKFLNERAIEYKIYNFDSNNENNEFDVNKCYKTIAFEYDGKFIFVCLKIKDSIDYNKLCLCLNIKRSELKKADIKELEVLFGYESGGISPIPISNKIQSFLDRKIQLEDNIFCGFGSKNKIMEIKGNDLISLSTDIFDISKS